MNKTSEAPERKSLGSNSKHLIYKVIKDCDEKCIERVITISQSLKRVSMLPGIFLSNIFCLEQNQPGLRKMSFIDSILP